MALFWSGSGFADEGSASYLQPEDYKIPDKQGKNVIRPCYLDIKNGFINFRDDSDDGKPNIRKLYYCNFAQKKSATDFNVSNLSALQASIIVLADHIF